MASDLVYVVHSEAGIAAQLSQALLSSEYKVVSMTTEEQADAALTGQQFVLPDAILTPLGDLESGDSILIRLLQSNPLMEQIPLVVVASSDKDERRRALRMGLLSVVFPPYDPEEVILSTKLAIEKHRSEQLLFGSLSQLSVPDLLQTAEVGRRSGTISFQHDGVKGQVWLRDGLIVNARIDATTPALTAIYEMVLWDSGTFEANFGAVEVEEALSLPPSEVVLEAMRRLDEGRLAGGDEQTDETDRRAVEAAAALELALTLVNVASSYTANHLDSELLEPRLEEVRQSLVDSAPALAGFAVGDGGAVSLAAAADQDVHDVLTAASRWVGAFFRCMDSALAWRFDGKRLAQLLAPWRDRLASENLLRELGISGLEGGEIEEDEGRVLSSRERPLALGCYTVEPDGRVSSYGPYGPHMGPVDPDRIVGRRLSAVLPAGAGGRAEKLLAALLDVDERSAVVETWHLETGRTPVSIRVVMVRCPATERILVTVNRVRARAPALSPEVLRDPLAGTVHDGGGNRLLAVNEDFLCAFEGLLARTLAHRHQDLLQRFGKQWGLRHALRVEQVVQQRYQMTLREVESHVALELLSGSIGVLGLGAFDAELSYRDRGLIVISHRHSPFPSLFASTSEASCAILAGFHAAVLSYLAGRQLAAREVCCSRAPGQPCLFVIATEDRLTKLFIATPGSPDHALLAEIAAVASRVTRP